MKQKKDRFVKPVMNPDRAAMAGVRPPERPRIRRPCGTALSRLLGSSCDDKEISMRFLVPSLVLAIAALTNATELASAQSPNSYPWCSRGGRSSANNCYFTSKEQCQRTISGIG